MTGRHRVIVMCESCHQHPAVYRIRTRGTVAFLVCAGCKPVIALRPTRLGRGVLWGLLLTLIAAVVIGLVVL